MDSASDILKAAAPFGPGIALVALTVSVAARILLTQSRIKIEAIRRARPEDIPGLAADEVTVIGITADGLTRQQRQAHVLEVLAQREKRSKRNFIFAVILSGALLLIAVLGVFQQRSEAGAQKEQVAWKLALSTIHELLTLDKGFHGHYKAGGSLMASSNRGDHLRLLQKLQVKFDARLEALRIRAIELVRSADADPGKDAQGQNDLGERFDMVYTWELANTLNELEEGIVDGALAKGVEVPSRPRLTDKFEH